MSEPGRASRPGRRSRPSPASLGVVKVDADFEQEYPGGDTTCTEAYASLCRTGEALLGELDRRIRLTFGIPQAAATALAVIDGADQPLTPSQVSERVLIASATMTATLDLLEHRGWIRRTPNPGDRRSVLIEITPAGRATTDRLLPGIRTLERSVLSTLTPEERVQLLGLLARILARTAEAAVSEPEPLHGQRIRPARLDGSRLPIQRIRPAQLDGPRLPIQRLLRQGWLPVTDPAPAPDGCPTSRRSTFASQPCGSRSQSAIGRCRPGLGPPPLSPTTRVPYCPALGWCRLASAPSYRGSETLRRVAR